VRSIFRIVLSACYVTCKRLSSSYYYNDLKTKGNNLLENIRTFHGSVAKFKYYCKEDYKSKTVFYDPDRPRVSWDAYRIWFLLLIPF
jgi:hypothetical protein